MLISTVVIDPARGFLLAVLLWGKVIAALIPPYVFAGMAISLALTRSPWPVQSPDSPTALRALTDA